MLADPVSPGMSPGDQSLMVTPAEFFNSRAEALVKANLTEKFGDFQEHLTQTESTIRPYFTVSCWSVLEKLKKMAFPFRVKDWSRSVEEGKPALPVVNPNLPELYTPIVFTFAFILVSSVIHGCNDDFTFEHSTRLFLKFIGFLIFDVLFAEIVFFAVGIPTSFPILQVIADLSSMTFYLTIETAVSWNTMLKYVALVYCGVCSIFWTIRTLNPKSAIKPVHPSPSHTYTILGVALLQAVAPFFLVE